MLDLSDCAIVLVETLLKRIFEVKKN